MVHNLQLSLDRLRSRSPDWSRIVTRTINLVGEERSWWKRECTTHPPSLSSELLHTFGVSLGTNDHSRSPVTRLLAFTGQYSKCVEYVMLKRPMAKSLLQFVLADAEACGNDEAVDKCLAAMLSLSSMRNHRVTL